MEALLSGLENNVSFEASYIPVLRYAAPALALMALHSLCSWSMPLFM